jgi:hypothetical protein
MHAKEDVARVVALGHMGLTATDISRRTGIPRRTVHDWLHCKVPRRGDKAGRRCAGCGHAPHRFASLPTRYAYLLGVYLGDGCISPHPRGVFRLRIALDAAYPRIIEETASAMRSVMPRNSVGRVDCGTWVQLNGYSKAWPCLFPQHGPGKKHERPIVLTPWQWELVERAPELLLRGLIHSDGCRFQNTGRGWSNPRYVFSNASGDIRGIFERTCALLDLHTTRSTRAVYVSRKADVARMDEFVGPKA